jgi:hypothetical protein
MENDPINDVRGIVVESLRMQLATLNAGITFWQGWVDRAAEFAQAASRDLFQLTDTKADVSKVIGQVTDTTRKYLRQVTELPNLAVAKFNEEMKPASRPTGAKRKRAARVKG